MNIQKKSSIFEKRKWVGITGACNNRCIFCLDGDKHKKLFKRRNEIIKDMIDGLKNNYTRLVISGGEATIHPDFLFFVKKGKELGYKKIQVISNGRRFAYENFLKKAIDAGVGEITFSVHGHNSKLHDSLTNTKGSFEQTIKGIRNALKNNIIVSCDIVINKKNINQLPQIIYFLLKIGVREYDLLHVMPYGNAWVNRKKLLYDPFKKAHILKKSIDIARKYDAVVWVNRFPPQCLEEYEGYIQDPIKLADEVFGRKEMFEDTLQKNKKLGCYGQRCKHCCMEELCNFIYSCNTKKIKDEKDSRNKEMIHDKIINITKNNIDNLDKIISDSKQNEKLIFSLANPGTDYKNYEMLVPKISDIMRKLTPYLESKRVKLKDMPPCFVKPEFRDHIIKDKSAHQTSFLKKGKFDIDNCCFFFINHKKIKSERCRKCVFYEDCEGVYQKYIMRYGFKELKPVTRI